MIWAPPLPDLVIDGIRAPGVPNQECIQVRATTQTNLASVGLFIGFRQGNETWPYRNSQYWFGNKVLPEGTQLNIYTGSGVDSQYPIGNGIWVHNLFWGLNVTVFDDSRVVPVLFRIGQATSIPNVLATAPLGALLSGPAGGAHRG